MNFRVPFTKQHNGKKYPARAHYTPPATDGNNIDPFKCEDCGRRLATKQLPDGEVVLKYPHGLCQPCWQLAETQVQDMVARPEKYGLLPQIIKFLGFLEFNEVRLVAKPSYLTEPQRRASTFLFEELMFELSYQDKGHDWEAYCKSLSEMLNSPLFYTESGKPKNKRHIMERIHELIKGGGV